MKPWHPLAAFVLTMAIAIGVWIWARDNGPTPQALQPGNADLGTKSVLPAAPTETDWNGTPPYLNTPYPTSRGETNVMQAYSAGLALGMNGGPDY